MSEAWAVIANAFRLAGGDEAMWEDEAKRAVAALRDAGWVDPEEAARLREDAKAHDELGTPSPQRTPLRRLVGEIDLTEAVRAASAALVRADPDVGQPGRVVRTVASYAKLADMAVRAAAPIIERAVRERIVAQLMVEQEGAHGGFVDGIWTAMAIVRGEATDA